MLIAVLTACGARTPHASSRDAGEARIDTSQSALTIVHFWGTWCVPCRAELPQLASAAAPLREGDARLVMIAEDERRSDVDAFMRSNNLKLETSLDPHRIVAARYDVTTFPSTLILSRSGNVLERFDGPVAWSSPETRAHLLLLAGTSR
jgi:thiol-disulfide isomerase/thioredoxin